MKFIDDGFTECVAKDGIVVEYRPLTSRGRGVLLERSKYLGSSILFNVARSRVVMSSQDIPQTPDWCDLLIGAGRMDIEKRDCRELYQRVLGHVRYPHLRKVDCNTCRAFWFDPITNEYTARDADGNPYPKDAGSVPLCETSTGCPLGHYTNPQRLEGKYLKAYLYHLECKASSFPLDAIVRRNASIIERAIQCASKMSSTS